MRLDVCLDCGVEISIVSILGRGFEKIAAELKAHAGGKECY